MISDSDIYYKLAYSAFPAFWNEYLVRVNCYRRRKIPLTKSNAWFSVMAFGPENRIIHRLRMIEWLAATFCNCLYLAIVPRVKASGAISLIPNVTDLKYLDPKRQVFRVGLYNFRFFQYPHILSVLTLFDKCRGCWHAFRKYGEFLKSCRLECEKRGVNFEIFCRLCNIGYLSFADYLLHYMALKKLGRVEVAIASQFEIYVSFLSTYRKIGLEFLLVGYQHGLFELPPEPHQYCPIHFDEYYFLFRESEPWFVKNFLSNPNCIIKHREHQSTITWKNVDREGFDKVLAYAAQDSLPYDLKIIDTLLFYAEDTNALLLIYFHPDYGDFPLQHRTESRNLKVFLRERHKNIDLLITRYSTLAMEYRSGLGVKVMFVPGNDSMCIFESGDVPICRDMEQIQTTLNRLLDLGEESRQKVKVAGEKK